MTCNFSFDIFRQPRTQFSRAAATFHFVNNWAFSSVLALQFAGVVLRPLASCSAVAPGEHVVVQFIRWARTLADAAARVWRGSRYALLIVVILIVPVHYVKIIWLGNV